LGQWLTVLLEHSTSLHGTRILISMYPYILDIDLTEVKPLLCIFLWNLRFCSWHCIRILSRIKPIPSFTHFNQFYSSCRRSLTDFLSIGRFISIWLNWVTQPYLDAPPPPLHMSEVENYMNTDSWQLFLLMSVCQVCMCMCVCVWCICVCAWTCEYLPSSVTLY
jgi:hypothetical protein